MYNVSIPAAVKGNLQAVASFLGQFYSPTDLESFQTLFGLPLVPISQTIGPNDPSQPGVEASLDVQYLTGVSNSSIDTWVLSTSGETPSQNEPFFKWLVGLNNLTQSKRVLFSKNQTDKPGSAEFDFHQLSRPRVFCLREVCEGLQSRVHGLLS